MPLPEQNLLAWNVCVSILHFLAMSSSVLRLVHRLRRRKLWWDDFLVIIAFSLETMDLVLMWLRSEPKYPALTLRPSSIFSFWFAAVMQFTILWFSRASLALSLARILEPGTTARRYILGLAALFVLADVGCIIILSTVCKFGPTPWAIIAVHHDCGTPPPSGIFSVIVDFVGDILLAMLPFIMLRRLKLPPVERRLVIAAFSSSAITLFATITFCVIWYGGIDLGPDSTFLRLMTAQIEVVFAMLACNLPVVATFFYVRFFKNPNSSDIETSSDRKNEPSTERSLRVLTPQVSVDTPLTHLTLTEVDLSILTDSSARQRAIISVPTTTDS